MTTAFIAGTALTALLLVTYWLGRVGGHLACRAESRRAAAEVLRCRIAVAKALPDLRCLGERLRAEHPSNDREATLIGLGRVTDALERLTWRSGPRYRHLRRGTRYEVVCEEAMLNASDHRLLRDGEALLLYLDLDSGRVCLRHPVEFHDGRFERLPTPTPGREYDAGAHSDLHAGAGG